MTGGHLGAVVLAEYDEGPLPDRLAADVAEHLAHCSTCTETHRQLAEVSRRLTAEPATLPMPADVAARLDDAFASEKPELAGPRATVTPVPSWRARMPTVLAAAAAVAAVAFAGYVVGTGSGGDDADEGRTTVAEGGTDQLADEAAKPVPDAGGDAGTAPARAALTEQIQQIVIQATSGIASDETDVDGSPETQGKQDNTARCGAALASDVGRDLIGAAPTDLDTAGAVLVVTAASTDGAVQGWVLPTCDATASDALATLTVPTR